MIQHLICDAHADVRAGALQALSLHSGGGHGRRRGNAGGANGAVRYICLVGTTGRNYRGLYVYDEEREVAVRLHTASTSPSQFSLPLDEHGAVDSPVGACYRFNISGGRRLQLLPKTRYMSDAVDAVHLRRRKHHRV